MFDYSDDEIVNNYVTNRNSYRRTRTGITEPKCEIDSGAGDLNNGKSYESNFQLQLNPAVTSELTEIHDSRLQSDFRLFKPRKLAHKKFPPSRNENDHPDSFFKSIKFVVGMAQLFSLLPVIGYSGPNYLSIRFRWFHWKIFYSLLFLLLTALILFCTALRNIRHGLTYDKSDGLVFFGSSFMAGILLLLLARNWSKINEDFARMEFKLLKYNYPDGITRQIRIFTCAFMTFALMSIVFNQNRGLTLKLFAIAEHILSKAAQIKLMLPCARDGTVLSIIQAFFANYYYEVFSYIPYSPWLGVVLLITQFVCTFIWNFADLLLTLIAWTICRRFQCFNKALFKFQGQEMDSHFWRKTRMDYNELSDLTRKVDSHIQKLMLLSLGDNLYFICIQLLKGLNSNRGNHYIYERIYFLWSVGLLIGRTCLVAFTAAGIHDESKEAKTVLFSVPEKSYCAETRRFLTQLITNDVALTGCKFFYITRGLILTIAGTVVTYEVILVQFNTGNDTTSMNKTNCPFT